ncbi:hypothetical protein ACFYOT_28220 [Saccharothrix saharensis]|uniref:hypothetical protein n=1 Tax=Saccharothrix saharensis TaxID=571190 RepID=UPI003683C731
MYNYDTPYNTHDHQGEPLTPPISNPNDVVIRALSPPTILPGRSLMRSQRLNIGELHSTISNTTLHFALSSVDDKGRLTSRHIFHYLQWHPGRIIAGTFGRNYLLLRPDADGKLTVGNRGRILLPKNYLRYCGIDTHSQVLLIAAADHQALVVHPQPNLAEMARTFHRAQFEQSIYGGVPLGDR